MKKIRLYVQTLKYLKISQLYWRIQRKIIKRPKLVSIQIHTQNIDLNLWISSISKKSSLISENPWKFTFLNQQGDLKHGWNDVSQSKLWLYNLHYHDFLCSDLNIETKFSLILDWIEKNPPQIGNGWEPYTLSLRIVNWIKFYFRYKVVPQGFWESLSLQTQSLMNQLEFHLLGNHLFENAKALIFSGCIFHSIHAQKWKEKGFSILKTQMQEQILDDGGHFERSPMYHAIILEDVLDLINLSKMLKFPFELKETLEKNAYQMFRWLNSMIHPDGDISFFNDTTFGISSSFEELSSYAKRLNISVKDTSLALHFMKNSQFVMAKNQDVYLVADMGSIAPNYQPGHAHAETFSFELSLYGERLFINRGISTYDNNSVRHEERGTSAHNTLCLYHENSSHVWSAFRVAERARVSNLFTKEEKETKIFGARHDGYLKKYGVYHERCFFLNPTSLKIKDILQGKGEHKAELFFHIHPSWQVVQKDHHHFIFSKKEKRVYLEFDQKTLCFLQPSVWSCEYHQHEPNQKIKVSLTTKVNAPWNTSITWDCK
ncbi:MAG: heparinase II/III domain-containing protein [Janthinobacterium lividum]